MRHNIRTCVFFFMFLERPSFWSEMKSAKNIFGSGLNILIKQALSSVWPFSFHSPSKCSGVEVGFINIEIRILLLMLFLQLQQMVISQCVKISPTINVYATAGTYMTSLLFTFCVIYLWKFFFFHYRTRYYLVLAFFLQNWF